MTKIEQLLQEGKKIVAERVEKEEAKREAYLQEIQSKELAIFQGARKEALRLFDPVGSEVLVQPCAPDIHSWDLSDNAMFKTCYFYVVLSENHGKIMVHLEGRRINGVWIWKIPKEDEKFIVENNFVVGDEDCGENKQSVYGRGKGITTNSLAEAIALADMESANYVAVREKAKKRSLSELVEKSIRKKTVAEELIDLLDRWHASRHADDE